MNYYFLLRLFFCVFFLFQIFISKTSVNNVFALAPTEFAKIQEKGEHLENLKNVVGEMYDLFNKNKINVNDLQGVLKKIDLLIDFYNRSFEPDLPKRENVDLGDKDELETGTDSVIDLRNKIIESLSVLNSEPELKSYLDLLKKRKVVEKEEPTKEVIERNIKNTADKLVELVIMPDIKIKAVEELKDKLFQFRYRMYALDREDFERKIGDDLTLEEQKLTDQINSFPFSNDIVNLRAAVYKYVLFVVRGVAVTELNINLEEKSIEELRKRVEEPEVVKVPVEAKKVIVIGEEAVEVLKEKTKKQVLEENMQKVVNEVIELVTKPEQERKEIKEMIFRLFEFKGKSKNIAEFNVDIVDRIFDKKQQELLLESLDSVYWEGNKNVFRRAFFTYIDNMQGLLSDANLAVKINENVFAGLRRTFAGKEYIKLPTISLNIAIDDKYKDTHGTIEAPNITKLSPKRMGNYNKAIEAFKDDSLFVAGEPNFSKRNVYFSNHLEANARTNSKDNVVLFDKRTCDDEDTVLLALIKESLRAKYPGDVNNLTNETRLAMLADLKFVELAAKRDNITYKEAANRMKAKLKISFGTSLIKTFTSEGAMRDYTKGIKYNFEQGMYARIDMAEALLSGDYGEGKKWTTWEALEEEMNMRKFDNIKDPKKNLESFTKLEETKKYDISAMLVPGIELESKLDEMAANHVVFQACADEA